MGQKHAVIELVISTHLYFNKDFFNGARENHFKLISQKQKKEEKNHNRKFDRDKIRDKESDREINRARKEI